jgi:hypothetical protein
MRFPGNTLRAVAPLEESARCMGNPAAKEG